MTKKTEKAESSEVVGDYFAYIRIVNTIDRFLTMAQQVGSNVVMETLGI